MLKRKMRWLAGDLHSFAIDAISPLKELGKWLAIFALSFVLFTILLPIALP